MVEFESDDVVEKSEEVEEVRATMSLHALHRLEHTVGCLDVTSVTQSQLFGTLEATCSLERLAAYGKHLRVLRYDRPVNVPVSRPCDTPETELCRCIFGENQLPKRSSLGAHTPHA